MCARAHPCGARGGEVQRAGAVARRYLRTRRGKWGGLIVLIVVLIIGVDY